MAHVPGDGPLGLEGRHQFKSGDQMPPGADNEASVYMYGRHRPDLGTSWIKIDRVTGLHGLGDADDFRSPALGHSGEVVYPSAQRGKTIVYEGRVVGMTLPALRQQAATLRRIASETRERVAGSITIVDPAATGAGFATRVRCIALDLDDVQSFGPTHRPTAYVRPFTLGVRAHDPRFIWYPESSSLGQANGASVVVANSGNAPADLGFDIKATGSGITGPLTIENLTLGVSLDFGVGDIVDPNNLMHISWEQRAIVQPVNITIPPSYTPNTDLMPLLDVANSNWWSAMEWGAGPGNNTIRVTAGGGIASWDVYWHHSSY